ncbi:MAG TPA: DUF72 domain-containing protein [Conexibacter sp.]|nr:DUF72 domain-containing protein [Conexibacter sp.]
MARAIRIGCSGWVYASWRESFYPARLPQARWLEHYATQFDTVELNSTFYRLARPDAAARWVEQTPPGFVFAAKASRYLTHMKRLTDLDRGVERYYASIAPLVESGKLGPVIWQLPERFTRDDERLAAALERVAQLPSGRHGFEFRHPSWFVPEVERLLRAHRVALVIGDRPERPFQTHWITADWTLVRFHHGRRGRRGNYSEAELRAWAQRIRAWSERVDVYAYFNNDWEVFAPRNARRLRTLLGV